MANATEVKNRLRQDYLDLITEAMTDRGEEVLVTGSNELAIPCVDSEGEERWITIKVQVPSGSHDGVPYDGYDAAENWRHEKAEAVAKKEAREKAAKEKAAKDARSRAEKKALREAKLAKTQT